MPLLSNGASRLLGGGARGLAVPVPSLGAELLTNGGFETGDPPSDWTASSGSALSSVTGRTGQALSAVRGTANGVATQAIVQGTGTWLFLDAWTKSSHNAYVVLSIGTSVQTAGNNTGTWQQYRLVRRVTTSGGKIIVPSIPTTAGNQGDFDDMSLRVITLASMFSARPYTTHATTKARTTIVAGTWAGVVANLDSASSPANFVIASHDGVTARLTKCVGGVYTELVSAAATYVAGAFVEIRRLAASDTWQLWYNGAQVGANQTISDAAIKAGVLHGYFNTYAGNLLSEFSCVASA